MPTEYKTMFVSAEDVERIIADVAARYFDGNASAALRYMVRYFATAKGRNGDLQPVIEPATATV